MPLVDETKYFNINYNLTGSFVQSCRIPLAKVPLISLRNGVLVRILKKYVYRILQNILNPGQDLISRSCIILIRSYTIKYLKFKTVKRILKEFFSFMDFDRKKMFLKISPEFKSN